MNIPEEMKELYSQHFLFNEMLLNRIFGTTEELFSFDTYQFEDYTKVAADRFNHEQKAQRRRDVFPKDCEKAFALGARLAKE